MQKIWKWIKENPWALIVAIVSTLGALFLWKASSNNIESLDDAIQVKAALREISRKEGKAEVLEEWGNLKKKELNLVKHDITLSKKRVIEIHNAENLDGLSDIEIANVFSDSGF